MSSGGVELSMRGRKDSMESYNTSEGLDAQPWGSQGRLQEWVAVARPLVRTLLIHWCIFFLLLTLMLYAQSDNLKVLTGATYAVRTFKLSDCAYSIR
jgi:hypothetical protein